ncbi:MAG: HEAT repeat domain-containing protein [Planctomycetota bacterium]|jgi:HEAT repeat protein
MKRLLIAALAIAGGGLWVGELDAHGGTYRGPGDTVPPGGGGGGGGGGPATGAPGGPATGGPGGPTTGGPAVPGGGPTGGGGGTSSGPVTGGGPPPVDLEYWSFWWEFNKDPFLNLQAAIDSGETVSGSSDFFIGAGQADQAKDSLRPNEAMIRGVIVPALLESLDNESNPDIITGCLIALAKIGEKSGENGDNAFEERITGFLSDPSQEISETAAIALGILASDASIDMLEALVRDDKVGQDAVGSTEVDPRTRAFAGYGLGLLGAQTTDEDLKRRINSIIVELLPDADRMARQDLAAALVISMGLTPLEAGAPKEEGDTSAWDPATTRQGQIDYLLTYLGDEERNFISRAHAPTAAARLLAGLDESLGYKEKVAGAMMDLLDPRSKNRNLQDEIKWSAALALGLVGDSDSDDIDAKIRETLTDDIDDQQRQGRLFGKIAMAKVAANRGNGTDVDEGRKELVDKLVADLLRGTGGDDHWSSIALGVYGFLLDEAGETPAASLGQALRSELEKSKSAQDIAALAVGNGLFQDKGSVEALLDKLAKVSEPLEKGYVALGLGLLEERSAIEPIAKVLEEATYKPDLLKQAAIALGLLGDKETTQTLIEMLDTANSLAAQASLAQALGFIGDARSVDPLVEFLLNDDRTQTARGFAAVALGIVADKEPLPWNSKLAVDLNYRAAVPTLNTTDGKGVLNIL